MSRLGYICDGCGDEHRHREPAAAVRDADGNWLDLCTGCWEKWDSGNRDEVME